jgi:hypothetical protein
VVKEKRFQTYPHRWGPGKIHRYIYNPRGKAWVLACRPNDFGDFAGPCGREVDPFLPVECRGCLAARAHGGDVVTNDLADVLTLVSEAADPAHVVAIFISEGE